MTKNNYYPRIIDSLLEETLSYIGAVLIVGPKWCGKTTTGEKHSKSVLKMQDPDQIKQNLALVDTKPSLLLKGDNPRLIDEWQVAPILWDAVRYEVDQRQKKGLFILTGSNAVDHSKIMHSGTGRITKLEMYPMSLYESKESNGKISLKALFSNPSLDIDGIKSSLSLEELIFASCRGGWPSSITATTNQEALYVAKTYLKSLCEEDVSKIDQVQRDPQKIRTFLKSYARNISTLASNKTILKDMQTNYVDISEPTLYQYINLMKNLFIIDEISAWNPSIRSASSIRSKTKKEFVDPSLAVAALDLSIDQLIYDLPTYGFIFKTLCIRDLKIYSSLLGGNISYYHDRYDLEADAVLHLQNGKYALIEFKLGNSQIEEGASHLCKLKDLIKTYNIKNPLHPLDEPTLLIIITGGDIAYKRNDGVYIIPIGCLKD